MKFKILLIHKLNKNIIVLLHNSVEKFNLTEQTNEKKSEENSIGQKQTITRENRPGETMKI